MKRSEAIRLIAEILDDMPSYEGYYNKDANLILSKLEKAGMLPPGYMKPIPFEKDGHQYPLVPGDFKNKEGVWCIPGVNEWELENE